MKKMFIVSTVPVCFSTFAKGQARFLSKHYQVELISSFSEDNKNIEKHEGVKMHIVNMTRRITPMQDLIALFLLISMFRKNKPDIIYSFTPKAGLLSMTAGFFARVPLRVHSIIGMPLMEAVGIKLFILKNIEQITYLFSTKLLCNSNGLKQYINDRLTKKQITVVGRGSINGIDTKHFKNIFSEQEKNNIKTRLNIHPNNYVLTYIGRVVKDKGINELIESFIDLRATNSRLKLLIVGNLEEDLNPIKTDNLKALNQCSGIIFRGYDFDVRKYLAISDIFILPSYREGLPNVLLEAGSFGLPIIATNINGCNEIVTHGENGLLVQKKNINSLRNTIQKLVCDTNLYNHLQSNARKTIKDNFSQDNFHQELLNEFRNI